MVKSARAKARVSASSPLNRPRPVKVVETSEGWPDQVYLKPTPTGVVLVEDRWRIDDEWWRERPISRMYFDCVLEDGQQVTVFRDIITGRWFRQAG